MINIKFKLDVDSIRAELPRLGLPIFSLLVGLDHVGLGELKYSHVGVDRLHPPTPVGVPVRSDASFRRIQLISQSQNLKFDSCYHTYIYHSVKFKCCKSYYHLYFF